MYAPAVAFASLITGIALTGVAQAAPSSESTSAHLPAVVVTAVGREHPIQDVIAPVEVIDRATIETFSGSSVTELLRFATGTATFSSGSTESVRLRGFGANQTLVLVDGQRRASRFGGQNLATLAVSEIERIEVIRGPMSALYGADALGGVVNIITRRAQANGEADLRIVAGSAEGAGRDTVQTSIGVGLVSAGTSHWLNGEYRTRAAVAERNSPQDRLNEHTLAAFSYRGHADLASQHWLEWSLEYQDQDDSGTRYIAPRGPAPGSTYSGIEREERHFAGLRLNGTPTETLDYHLALGHSHTDGAARRQPNLIETTDFRLTQLDARMNRQLGAHLLSLSAGGLREVIDINTNSRKAERDNHYLLAQNEWRLPANVNAIFGVRYDDYSDFGSTVNPRAGATWQLGNAQLRVNYGTGFRAPSSLEQYSSFVRGNSLITGNPELEPETARMTDIGWRWLRRDGSLDIGVYESHVDDLIASERTGEVRDGLNVLQYRNVERARLRGLEAAIAQRITDWLDISLRYDYLDARDRDSDARLTGRARHSGKATVGMQASNWRTELRALRIVDFYNNEGPGIEPVDRNYARLDLYAERLLRRQWRVFAGIDNLLDRADPDTAARSITTDPGTRYYWAGIRWQTR
ncbi:hypothetical protein CAI21_13765 [Alkalilimnicola ehrlichii]|uniref:TonB-dependent receptor n=1 Tax=Alkalilimnicola ehrlichii TaxID=351052 RepID=A0A3E0WP92_9GAMM|nr:TonB-dependent receptor [Alkalilimnicola ehrlichii]RFA27980.1 hypothetical protein CAI21_13765 [Alkalilimnicola ehrlichii]RFA34628.1 hypothetical protein CAL65_14795 [Alkalilimnicola ehrlichii]